MHRCQALPQFKRSIPPSVLYPRMDDQKPVVQNSEGHLDNGLKDRDRVLVPCHGDLT